MPDFTMKPTFPVASVIDAAQRNNQLQQQAREAGNQSLIAGLQSIGQVGESLYNQKLRMAQALAGAKMYSQTPEGQQMLGTNQVATGPAGQPVQANQTANYNPETGTATPNQSPLNVTDMATSMLGMSPKDMFENQIQQRAAQTQQGELALKQQTEPKRLAIEQQKTTIEQGIQNLLAGIKGQEAGTQAIHTANEHEDALRARRDTLVKNLSIFGKFGLSPSSNASQAEIANIDSLLAQKGSGPLPGKKFSTSSGVTYKVNQ